MLTVVATGVSMRLDGILERNRDYVRSRKPHPLPPPETMALAVVACYDPRLDDLLLPALGLRPGDAFLLRTAGALVLPDGGVLRSLGLAVFMFGVIEILVLGHSSCRMAHFENARFIETFRRRGVPREAFGAEDLRVWAGAIPDPKRGVQASVANIRSAAFLPRGVAVAGMVLDDATGVVEPVVRPGETLEGVPVQYPEVGAAPEASAPATPAAPGSTEPVAPLAARPAPQGDPLIAAVDSLVQTLQSKSGRVDEVQRLRQEMARQTSPLAKLGLLESFVRQAAADSKDVGQAFERVKRHAAASGRSFDPGELVELFLSRTGRR